MVVDFEDFKAWLESDGEIEFDMHAQDPERFLFLRAEYPSLHVSSAGGIAPFEAMGIIDGHPFYYRDEWGEASLTVGHPDGETPFFLPEILWKSGMSTVDGREGEDFEKNLLELVKRLERAPFNFYFEGHKIVWTSYSERIWEVDLTQRERVFGIGHTAEAAYHSLFEPVPVLSQNDFPPDKQFAVAVAREIDPTPLNEDTRPFPDVDPPFLRYGK